MNGKKIIICMAAIITIIIVILCLLLINQQNIKKEHSDNITTVSDNEKTDTDNEIDKISIDKTKFFTVSNCVIQYLDEINKNNTKYYGANDEGEYTKIVEDDYIKKNIYSLLSEEYIEANNITEDNIYKYIPNITEQLIFTPIKMKCLQYDEIEKYIVYGAIENTNNPTNMKELYLIVNLDINNMTFSIEPLLDSYTNIEDIKINTNNIVNIEKNDNNTFEYINATDEYITNQYLNAYKRFALLNPQVAYSYLDEEYKEKRFGNLENYKKYIEKNHNKILAATISKYKVSKEDDYTQYVCITEVGDYYIFKQTNIMEYSIILDTYTIDLPEYIEKYTASTDNQKTAFCIDKFIKVINSENYTLAYSMLADSFKNNYFKTQESFENYAKNYFLGKQKGIYREFKNEGNVYCTYTVSLKTSDEDTKPLEKTFIVKLKEGTDFELSFNVD